MKTTKKSRMTLFASLGVSLVAVLASAISTFAWFQADAAATINAEGDEAEITVAAPDPIEVSNPELYVYRGEPTNKTVSSDYTKVTSAALRTTSNFYPGEKVTYAIKVNATEGTISSGSMNLTYQGYSLSNRVLQGAITKVINILSAIKVTTGANGTGSYPSMTEKLSPIARGSEPLLSSLSRVSTTSSYYKEATINSAINGASIASTTAYFFATVEFLNTTSTFYKEVTSGGADIHTTPKNDSSTRYFSGNNSGSSTCYEGLKFILTTFALTVS